MSKGVASSDKDPFEPKSFVAFVKKENQAYTDTDQQHEAGEFCDVLLRKFDLHASEFGPTDQHQLHHMPKEVTFAHIFVKNRYLTQEGYKVSDVLLGLEQAPQYICFEFAREDTLEKMRSELTAQFNLEMSFAIDGYENSAVYVASCLTYYHASKKPDDETKTSAHHFACVNTVNGWFRMEDGSKTPHDIPSFVSLLLLLSSPLTLKYSHLRSS